MANTPLFLLSTLIFVAFLMSPTSFGNDGDDINEKPSSEVILVDQPPEAFISVLRSELPEPVSSEMKNRLLMLLEPEWLPWGDVKFDAAIYLATADNEDDLVVFTGKINEYEVRIISSRTLTRLQIGLPEPQREVLMEGGSIESGAIGNMIEQMVHCRGVDIRDQDYHIQIPWPKELRNGLWFSSNPDQMLARLGMWHQRVDVAVDDAIVSVSTYWKPPQHIGFLLKRSEWFPDDFRAQMNERAAEQRKGG